MTGSDQSSDQTCANHNQEEPSKLGPMSLHEKITAGEMGLLIPLDFWWQAGHRRVFNPESDH